MGSKVPGMGKGQISKVNDAANHAPEEARRNALRRTLLAREIGKKKCTTPQEMQERFDTLFEKCLEEGFVPNVEMLALAAGCNRRTLWDLETGVTHKGEGYSDIIMSAKELIASIDGTLACENKMNATVYVFRAKNYYGMSDRQEIEVKPVNGNQLPENSDDIINAIPELNPGE